MNSLCPFPSQQTYHFREVTAVGYEQDKSVNRRTGRNGYRESDDRTCGIFRSPEEEIRSGTAADSGKSSNPNTGTAAAMLLLGAVSAAATAVIYRKKN